MLLAMGNDGQFGRFCQAAGHPEWAQDMRFASNTLRVRHRSERVLLMEAVTRTRSTAAWVALLQGKAVPCGPINTITDAFSDTQVQARGLRVVQQRDAGDAIAAIAGVASPLRLASHPPVLRHAPPALGQHTHEVLSELGLGTEHIAQLRSRGVV